MDKLVSFIVPTYNAQSCIARCLNSLISQEIACEIIVINDCSVDNTDYICRKYVEKYNNIIYIKLDENMGVSFARNTGLSHATGEFVIFVDSDDYIDSIKPIYNILNQKFDLVIFGRKYIREQEVLECPLPYAGLITKDELIKNHLKTFLNVNSSIWVTNKLYKNKIIQDQNIKFDVGVNFSEDLYFNLKYFKHIETIYYSNNYISYYDRNIPNSLSRIHEKYNISKVIENRNKVYRFLQSFSDINYSVYFEDYKNILIYSINKVLTNQFSKLEEKLEELKYVKKTPKEILEFLNENNFIEFLLKQYISQNNN